MPRSHPRHRLSHRSGAPLNQRLGHNRGTSGRDHSGWNSQAWLCPRRRWDALSPLCRSHDHAYYRCPQRDPHGHRAVALTGIHGLYTTTDLILQCGSLGQNKPETLVLALLSDLLSTKPTKSPNSHITRPRIPLTVRVESLC